MGSPLPPWFVVRVTATGLAQEGNSVPRPGGGVTARVCTDSESQPDKELLAITGGAG